MDTRDPCPRASGSGMATLGEGVVRHASERRLELRRDPTAPVELPGVASCGQVPRPARSSAAAARSRRCWPPAAATAAPHPRAGPATWSQAGYRCRGRTTRSPGRCSKDNPAIKNGQLAETGATLKIYNWVAYVNQKCLNDFGKKYNCKVEVTTFNTMTEALAKLSSGQVNFDVFMGVTVDVLGRLIEQKTIPLLNHSYIPNINQAWTDFTNPFYDQRWRYTVPYTIYTTGIAWRKDHVPENPYTMANPWAMPWQGEVQGQGRDTRRLP